MSFYARMQPPHPPGPNPWSTVRKDRHPNSKQACAQDASFFSAFAANPPPALPAEHWPSLNNWVAYQKKIRLWEEKRQLAGQLYRVIEVEYFRAAALRQMHMEEGGWSQQQQQQQQNFSFNGFPYNSADTASGEFAPDARFEEPMQAGLQAPPQPQLAVYGDNAFANESGQVYVGECYSNEHGGVPNASESMPGTSGSLYTGGVGPSGGDWTGTVQPEQQEQQDSTLAPAPPMPPPETAKVRSVWSAANGLAAYVADLKSQMAERINAGGCALDASTARGYEMYTRTPEFFRSRRSRGATIVQDYLNSIGHSQVDVLPEASGGQAPNRSTTSEDVRTPDLDHDSQDQSCDSVNSFEHHPEEPVFRSPDGPGLKILAPKPASHRSPLLHMTSESLEAAGVDYLCQGYGDKQGAMEQLFEVNQPNGSLSAPVNEFLSVHGVDDMGALHWQLPDWLWDYKTQEEAVLSGVSYDFNYPPRGYAATPEFVELRYGGERDYPVSVGYYGEAGALAEELNDGGDSTLVHQTPSESHSGCTPCYFMDDQYPRYANGSDDITGGGHEEPTLPKPLPDYQEALQTGHYTIPQAYEQTQAVAPPGIPQQSDVDLFANQPGVNVLGRPALMSEEAYNNFGHPTPPAQDPERTEGQLGSRTPPNRFLRPIDSDPITPKSPVFQKSTFPEAAQFNVHDLSTEHLFTPSPHKTASSAPQFVLHTRKSNKNKNSGKAKVQPIAAVQARRTAIDAYLRIPADQSALPTAWPTPEPETPPPSSPYPYSVDTPSPSELVHKRHLKIRRAKLAAKRTDSTIAQKYRY